MQEYSIKTDIFEGPLALLMHLINKNEIDIYDIPIAIITEQYLNYLQAMKEFNIDIASDFLVMAATLLQIKSRMLLPKSKPTEEEIEEDPRQELVDQLLEYRQYKEIAEKMRVLQEQRNRYFFRQPVLLPKRNPLPEGLTLNDLINAFAALWESTADQYAVVTREQISVQDKMADIMYILHKSNGKVDFSKTIFRSRSRSEVIACFLALLELMRLQRIKIEQDFLYSPIMIILRKEEA